MRLRDRVLGTTINNLMMAASVWLGAYLAAKSIPWLISEGVLPLQMVMK
ncbi:membrane protein [Streptomyces phage phiRKBJ001]|nr:membrane protein [Streptomyces phage phiRKBJ001]